MAYIKLTLDHPLVDGESVTFKAPCDCTAVNGIKVYYVELTETSETTQSKIFTFTDSHGNNLTGVGNLFETNAYVKAILDTTNNKAYVQNADTNAYLEYKFTEIQGAFVAKAGDTMTGALYAASSGQTPSTYLVRNSKLSATEETPSVNGQICWHYE